MIVKFLRYIKGYVKFKATNGVAERLINACSKECLSVFNIKKCDEGIIGYVALNDYKRLVALSNSLNIDILKLYERGFVPRILKYKYRYGLYAGILLFIIGLTLSQYFIFEINVEGNERTSTSIILSELKDSGIDKFRFIPKIDFREKREEVLLKLPQLSWMTMNRIGCKLQVIVTERLFSPVIDERTPCNVVAARTGVIKHIEVYNGTKLIAENCPVVKGEVVVASKYVAKNGNTSFVHADAKIIAEVEFDKQISVDINELSKEYTNSDRKIYAVNLFGFKIPFGFLPNSSETCDIEAISYPIHLFKKELPIGILKYQIKPYRKNPMKLSRKKQPR